MYFLMMLQFFKSEKFSRASSQGTMKRQTLLVLTLMSFQLVPLVKFLFTALMITLKSLFLLLMDSGHVVLQAGVPDKGLGATISRTLVWLFPTVTELMSGELVAGAEALVTALTGEWFQSCVFAKVSIKPPRFTECSFTIKK